MFSQFADFMGKRTAKLLGETVRSRSWQVYGGQSGASWETILFEIGGIVKSAPFIWNWNDSFFYNFSGRKDVNSNKNKDHGVMFFLS